MIGQNFDLTALSEAINKYEEWDCKGNPGKGIAEAFNYLFPLVAPLQVPASEPVQLTKLETVVLDSWTNYERMGEVCSFEGNPMIYASTLEEIYGALIIPQPVQTSPSRIVSIDCDGKHEWVPDSSGDIVCCACGISQITQPANDAQDALRYRFIRANSYVELWCDSPKVSSWTEAVFDEKVDRAIAQLKGKS